MRALQVGAYNGQWASLMGIPVDRIIAAMTFCHRFSLAPPPARVLVGIANIRKIEPLMGIMIGLKAFVAAVLGGIGNIAGAVLGALIMGIAEEFVVGCMAQVPIVMP